MKWMSIANSSPQLQSKSFCYTSDCKTHTETIADQYQTTPPHPFGFYSVTRINPLYIEEASTLPLTSDTAASVDCNQHCRKTDYLHASPLRDNTISVLKQNSEFIRSILVSVHQDRCHKRNGLTTIHEGSVDCIPRPVWPADETVDLRYDASSVQKLPEHKHKRWKYDTAIKPTMAPDINKPQKSLPDILRELSISINNAMANADQVEIPPETILHSLREKINKCLESCMLPQVVDSAELSLKDNAVATLSRAFSFVNSFNHGSQDDLEKGRLLLLKRLGRFPAGELLYEHVQQPSSSSSSGTSSSSSGFSDLTHTPASSNSSASNSPPFSRTTENGNTQTECKKCKNKFVSCRDNNVVCKISGSCDNMNNTFSFNSFEYHVVPNPKKTNSNATKALVDALKRTEHQSQVSVLTKSDTLLSSYPGRRCPDFTLDVQQAEKVMKKIKERKRERCWCRVITSFVGFAFLLFSVMFFSMMLTRGEKMFGSL